MKKTSVEKHFDRVAEEYDKGKKKYSYYYENLKKLLHSEIPYSKKVLEIGCGTGDLLVSLRPKQGYGQDISSEMIKIAKNKHTNMNSIFSTKWPKGKFDYIFMSDVIEHLEKPEREFKQISKLLNKKSKLIITMANPLWEPMLMFWERMGWKMKEGKHKRIKFTEINTLLKKSGLEVVTHDYFLLIPISTLLTNLVNQYFGKMFKRLSFIEFVVAIKS